MAGWTVIGLRVKQGSVYFVPCRCACGIERLVRSANGRLTTFQCRSCNAVDRLDDARRMGRVNPSHPRHGHARTSATTKTYRTWSSMKERCSRPKNVNWMDYGARGIMVCDRWRESFENFLADMGEKPVGATLERKENDGHYEPSNCRWATPLEQGANKRNNVLIKHDGRVQHQSAWAKEAGISKQLLRQRMAKGWPMSRCLATPRFWNKD